MSEKNTSPHHLTKIIATLGPASDSYEVIKQLVLAGVNLFRLNFSHGTHENHNQSVEHIRKVEQELDQPIGIIADLQGPKLRVSSVPDKGIELKKGNKFYLHLNPINADEIKDACSLEHPEIFAAAKAKASLLLDDGNLRLHIDKVEKEVLHTTVEVGGLLKPRKGVNYPGHELPIAALTDKDKEDLAFALEVDVDWVALSFVQREADLIEAKELIGKKARLIAKIEKPLAVNNFSKLVPHCDAVMIARGDLGVETPFEEVPALQKKLIMECRQAGCPVIVATQMLESMTHSPTPTRAEASDVATALYDGADCVMLSAESASGDYPVRAVQYMVKIILSTESNPLHQELMHKDSLKLTTDSPGAIVSAAHTVADVVKAKAIVTFSKTGNTTLRASRLRPNCFLLGLTPLIKTARATTLFWGVRPVVTEELSRTQEMVVKASNLAQKYKYVDDGDYIVVTAGLPLGVPGRTNVLRLGVVGEEAQE